MNSVHGFAMAAGLRVAKSAVQPLTSSTGIAAQARLIEVNSIIRSRSQPLRPHYCRGSAAVRAARSGVPDPPRHGQQHQAQRGASNALARPKARPCCTSRPGTSRRCSRQPAARRSERPCGQAMDAAPASGWPVRRLHRLRWPAAPVRARSTATPMARPSERPWHQPAA